MVIQTSIKLKPLWMPCRSCSICPLRLSRHLSRDCLLPENQIFFKARRRRCCLWLTTPPLFIYLCKWRMAIGSRDHPRWWSVLTAPPPAHAKEVIRWQVWMRWSTSELRLHRQMLMQIVLRAAAQVLPVPPSKELKQHQIFRGVYWG